MNHAGELVGAYRLVRPLGRGGMGEVWLGEHEQIGSKVAIKLVLGDPKDATARERFLREAKATARVRHPNIVAVSDYGARAGGGSYLVMELLDGRTLAERAKPVPVELALEIGAQIADALVAAHASGVVHRDLKPNNIFLVDDPAARHGVRVKLLDFGIAKSTGTDLGMTATGQLVGTPLYMAPEQCTTRLGAIDHRTDLYALGCVLYELVTGRPPFPGPAFGDLVDQHVNATPTPPPTTARLVTLIMRLLAKRQGDRPESASSVARTLRELAGGSRDEAVVSAHSETVASTISPVPAISVVTPPSRAKWVALAGAIALGIGAVLLASWPSAPRSDISKLDAAGLERVCKDRDGDACLALARTEHRGAAAPSLSRVFANYQAACDLKNAAACAHLAWMHAWGAGVRGDAQLARRLADTTCTAGIALGCDVAGDLATAGLGGSHDLRVAEAYYRRGCELGSPDPCSSLGRMLYHGMGEVHDAAAGKRYLQRAFELGTKLCETGDAGGCRNAGLAYLRGIVTPKDPARSATLVGRACELGSAEACNDAGQLYAMGIGVAKDPAAADRMLARACDRGYAYGCAVYAIAVANGMTGPIDAAKAIGLAREACDRGDRNCVVLGNFYSIGTGVERDPQVALVHYERACKAGDPEACAQVASAKPADREPMLARSCELGGFFGCKTYGDALKERGDYPAAYTAYARACSISDAEIGCEQLALLHLDGLGTPVDVTRGREILERGCAANVMYTCHVLGVRLRDGKGLPASAAAAHAAFEKGCTLGWARSCLAAADQLSTPASGLTQDPNRARELRARGCVLEPNICK